MEELRFPTQQIQETIRHQIIPLVRNGAPIVVLASPPFVVSYGKPQIAIREIEPAILPPQHGIGRGVRIQQWHEENLNAFNVPYWGCVTDGEADLVVEATGELCRMHGLQPSRWVVTLPPGTLFWLPPGMAITMSGAHWERPHPEQARGRIFWMFITPAGANCHFCSTSRGKHWIHPSVFAPGMNLLRLGRRITQELEKRGRDYQEIISHSLQLLLLDTLRGLQERGKPNVISEDEMAFTMDEDSTLVLQHALQYIEERFIDSDLKVDDIARYSHVSVTHLGRLFRRHLQTSVRQFIINKRLEMACQLLEESTFSVRQIGIYCGYSHASTFVAAFEKKYDQTPSIYRREHQLPKRFS